MKIFRFDCWVVKGPKDTPSIPVKWTCYSNNPFKRNFRVEYQKALDCKEYENKATFKGTDLKLILDRIQQYRKYDEVTIRAYMYLEIDLMTVCGK